MPARRVAAILLLAAAVAAQDAIDEGRALLGGPDHEKGVALVRAGLAALAKEPETAATLHRTGLGRFYLEEDAEAQAAFRKAAQLDPDDPEHLFMLAIVQGYGDPAAAADTMRKAIGIAPEEPRLRFELGRLLGRLERPAEALAAHLEACRLDPAHAGAHHEAANLLVAAGKEEEALAHYAKAVEAHPGFVDAWYNAAQLHYNRDRFAEALAAWAKAAELAPGDFQIRTKLVQAHYALGRYEEAEAHRTQVVALRPEGAREFCFDQFVVGELRVFAYETFDKEGDLYYHFTFKAVTREGKLDRTVNLESSAVIREQGVNYVLGANLADGVHRNYGIFWKELPPYPKLKELVVRALKGELD